MAPIFGIKTLVHLGTEFYEVMDDSVTEWCTKLSDIQMDTGPFEPLGNGAPHTLKCVADLDAVDLLTDDPTRRMAIAFNGPCGAATPSDFHHELDNGDLERIVFCGKLGDWKAVTPRRDGSTYMQISMPGDDSWIFNARSRLAAATNHGVNTTLTDIAADLIGIGMDTSTHDSFPDGSTGYSLDREAQATDTNGSYLQSHTAGYGMWTTCQWSASYTDDVPSVIAAAFRPSYYADWHSTTDLACLEQITMDYPWLLEYPDYGRQWGDHPNRYTVTGRNGAGDPKTGGYNQGQEAALGYLEASASTYIDNDTQCGNAAENLARQCALPYTKIFDVTIRIEKLYKQLVAAGATTNAAEELCWKLGAIRVGDQLTLATEAYSGGEPIPADSWTTEEQLVEIVEPLVEPLEGDGTTRWNHKVTRVHREWHPRLGWKLSLSLRYNAGWS